MVVRGAGKNRVAAIDLLQQHDARELMGQRHRAERQAVSGSIELNSVGATDHKAEIQAAGAALLKEAAEGDAVVLLAGVIEQHKMGLIGNTLRQLLRLTQLDQLDRRVVANQFFVVGDVIGVGRAQAAYR